MQALLELEKIIAEKDSFLRQALYRNWKDTWLATCHSSHTLDAEQVLEMGEEKAMALLTKNIGMEFGHMIITAPALSYIQVPETYFHAMTFRARCAVLKERV